MDVPFDKTLPSFSIILETENLANADLEGLSRSLASLVNQDVSPSQANEVLLIDSGDTPPDLLEQLCDRYPWIKIHPAPAGTGYYKAKMLGAQVATGDIIVYCDSDCIYEPTWLRTILTTFTQGEPIQAVAGETTTRGIGPYGTAMALTYIFPQYTGETALTPSSQYFLNNVAFRRQFLLENPIPLELPLYRGNCVIHAYNLLKDGHTIWRQPKARATHAPPNGLSHFFWRFLLIGHDYYWQNRLLSKPDQEPGNREKYRDPLGGLHGKMHVFLERLQRMVKNEPRHLLYLPLSIPIAAISVLLIFAGNKITALKPDYLLKTYYRILGEV
ncbi:glycosyltransferase [Leptothermofonsia sp. ETS-13]|uniref:glycosyltransferase n=1 Tax=Leptothermofonsia sp. ETS-13 TaxID=3035696 RepID=UPI003B9ED9AC